MYKETFLISYLNFAQNTTVQDVEYMVTHGADINAKPSNGFSPLKIAVHDKNKKDIVRLLVTYGAKIESLGPNSYGLFEDLYCPDIFTKDQLLVARILTSLP